ncbi:MAG TPA: helix-turn-helix domain-containing protein [Thermoanaerobaculia bacterium]
MPKKTPPSPFGVNLSVLRAVQGWPQNELADALGVGAPLLSGYESGDKTLSRERLEEIVARMGLPAEAVDRTQAYLLSIRSLSPPEGGAMPVSARAEANVAWVRDAAEAFARSLVALPPERRAEDARRQARDLWNRLKKASPRERRALVKATEDFRSWALCELVCERSLEAAADRADRALDLADLAVYIAEMAPGEQTWRKRLRGYALAHLGNAKRVGGDLPAADQVFAKARKFWEAGEAAGVGFLSEAVVFGMEASLRINQRRFPEALSLLDEALAADKGTLRKHLLISRANILELVGDFGGAITALREVVSSISAEGEPRLLWVVLFNLVNNLLQAGLPEEAEEWLSALEKLTIQIGNGLDTTRLHWLEGRVLSSLGRKEEAIVVLRKVREDFTNQRIAYDAALVSLELAALFFEVEQAGEVRSLARQILWILQSQGVHREALAALRLFCKAAEQETATLAMARRLSEYLQRARNEPGLRFEDGGYEPAHERR